LQNPHCIKTGQHVIQHDANAMGNPFAGFDGKRFYDIENAEQQKSSAIESYRVGQKPEADQLAGHLVYDALARVFFFEMLISNCRGRNAYKENNACDQRHNRERQRWSRDEIDDKRDDQ
jgi:hypothetical protein